MISKSRWHVRNKWNRHLALAVDKRILKRIPESSLLSKRSMERFLSRHRTVFVKPVRGSYGNHIMKITRKGAGFMMQQEKRVTRIKRMNIHPAVLRHTKGRAFMLQKGVGLIRVKGKLADYRLLLLRPGKHWLVMGIMGKVAAGNLIVTNYRHGGKPIQLRESLRQAGWIASDITRIQRSIRLLGLRAARVFNRRYPNCRRLGIDIAIDANKRIWIIEVNTNPSYDLFRYHEDKTLHRKIAGHMNTIQRGQSNKY